jgi:hypothetical protein
MFLVLVIVGNRCQLEFTSSDTNKSKADNGSLGYQTITEGGALLIASHPILKLLKEKKDHV